MKALNKDNQFLLNNILAKIEFYKNVPDQKVVWEAMAKDVQASKARI